MLLANFSAALCAVAIIGAGLWAYSATPGGRTWPMQWGITGAVNWRAPRPAALTLSLLVSISVIAFVAYAANAKEWPALLVIVSLFQVAAFCGYFLAVVRDHRNAATEY
jgi:hypothetical protein